MAATKTTYTVTDPAGEAITFTTTRDVTHVRFLHVVSNLGDGGISYKMTMHSSEAIARNGANAGSGWSKTRTIAKVTPVA